MKIPFLFGIMLLLSNALFSQNLKVLRIDPYYARGGTAGQIFQEVNYIPLETTKESLFGRVSQLLVTDQYFIVLDQNTNTVLFFFKDGRYHCKITGGNSTIPENTIHNISLSAHKNELVIQQLNKFASYNFDGRKLKEERHKNLKWSFQLTDSVSVMSKYFPDKSLKDSVVHELQFLKGGHVYRELKPFNQKKDQLAYDAYYQSPSHPVLTKSNTDSAAIYWRPYDYQVYEVSPAGIKTKYSFIFPLNMSLPEGFTRDSSFNGKRIDFLQKNKQVIFGITNFYELGNNIFFKTSISKTGDNAFIYNLKSGNLISITKISPDSSSAYLPVVSLGSEFSNYNFLTREGEHLYASIPSLLMFRHKEATTDKNPVYTGRLKTYFETGTQQDNPVIIQLKPKDHL